MSACLEAESSDSTGKALPHGGWDTGKTLLCGEEAAGSLRSCAHSGSGARLPGAHPADGLEVTNDPQAPLIAAMAVTAEDWEQANNAPSKGDWLTENGSAVSTQP